MRPITHNTTTLPHLSVAGPAQRNAKTPLAAGVSVCARALRRASLLLQLHQHDLERLVANVYRGVGQSRPRNARPEQREGFLQVDAGARGEFGFPAPGKFLRAAANPEDGRERRPSVASPRELTGDELLTRGEQS
jgi:hypothetical protein